MNNILYSSNSDEWYTPLDLFNNLDREFHFTLDPCANGFTHLCKKEYTKKENGLLHNWDNEIVFCNPPYSDIETWVRKCYTEYWAHNTTIVLLIPVRTDTKYFHDYIYNVAEIRFIRGRLHFSNSKFSAPFPSMIVIYKNNTLHLY